MQKYGLISVRVHECVLTFSFHGQNQWCKVDIKKPTCQWFGRISALTNTKKARQNDFAGL
ncbi:hypothetical protein [Salibacter halophilus]|uniref:Uncharacterized protein n=1 Tax=Salibacter halophilus TaxID=1803916 RepID=A0A6N6M7K4_9FLAO|nr:hypothetical protein [Salibacter halophilus]KAB1064492.1 hypothetical protein F3059_07285 [Salibacter halophilus]